MEILPLRDIYQDDLGNYYVVYKVEGKKVYITNAIVHYAFRRILSNEFVDEVSKKYDKRVAVGQYFSDVLKNRVEGIQSGKYKGNVFPLEELTEEYEVYNMPFYHREIGK